MLITAQNFPTPQLAWRTHDLAKLRTIQSFAHAQAATATNLLDLLNLRRFEIVQRHKRKMILAEAFDWVCQWRYFEALKSPRPQGDHDAGVDPKRYLITIAEAGVNYDRLGTVGRMRDGSTWDEQTRTYVGGMPTPASEILAHYGAIARDRIAALGDHDDQYINVVTIPGAGRLLTGNRLVSGVWARRVADDLVARMARRGVDVSKIETGGELIYAITTRAEWAEVLRNIAFIQLAGALEHDELAGRIEAWQLARYLLYQGPKYKKGSDAVIRVFLVAVGALLFGTAPVMQQDADLRCMVLPQEEALTMPADAALYETTTMKRTR